MTKAAEAFRTISEVAEAMGTPAHVLRFWESKFPQVKPVKRAGGRRYYRPSDVALLAGIKVLLHDRGITIRGVQKILREDGVRQVAALADEIISPPAAPATTPTRNADEAPARATASIVRRRTANAPKAPMMPEITQAQPESDVAANAPDTPTQHSTANPRDSQAPMLFDALPEAPAPIAAPTPAKSTVAEEPPRPLWSERLRRAAPQATPEIATVAGALAARAVALRARLASPARP